MSAERALVTGGHGFVGSHLAAALLHEGWTVRVLDRPSPRRTDLGGPRPSGLDLLGLAGEVELHEADLLDAGEVASAVAGCDAVFHLAAQTIVGIATRSPVETYEVNVRGAWNVFEACREATVATVLFASSDKAYGTAPELPYREDFPLRGAHPYDASKAAAETIARGYAVAAGLPLAVTRFANVYGGGDLNFTRLIPETARALCEGRGPRIRSDGSPRRDFIHVEDAVAAYLAIAAAVRDGGAAPGEAFNAGGDRPHSVREVVEELARAAGGTELAPRWGPGVPAGEIVDQYLDSTKLRELTGWAPRVGLAAGLARTLEWYREHPEVLP
ncbi:MAG: NAD-dependent epimerase/dehydratase family protein [Actinobacteria bacterium]|nr:NAD-dependent epimerase/dehydratase family protein [Actinomycetota bacterium]